jgi:stage IV sporulation protein FB
VSALLEPTPTPLDVYFHCLGTPVRVSAWFWVLPGVIGSASAAFLGPGYLFLAPACFFVSMLLHEFGHVFAGRCYGQDGYVVLNAFGGVAVGSTDVAGRWPRILVFAAGPLAQLLLGGLLWAVSEPVLTAFPPRSPYGEPVTYTLICLELVSLSAALLNLVPLWPLDGWHIARELYEYLRGNNRPPWEVDADWWKRGVKGSDYRPSWRAGGHARGSNRLPLTVLLAAGVLALGWSVWDGRFGMTSATALMERYKRDPDAATALGWLRPVTFKGVLRKPPWEPALYQYGGGSDALVYFVTDNPGEWIFCEIEYNERLGELQEGGQYIVSGKVYHFDRDGKLFLRRCSLRKAD